MGPYNIPRNTKGEGRILYIFSTKALIYTGAGALIGALFYFIFSIVGLTMIGYIFVAIFGLIGFLIATFKVPNIKNFEATKNVGGEQIDEIIRRVIRFKMKKNKKYTYFKKEDSYNG